MKKILRVDRFMPITSHPINTDLKLINFTNKKFKLQRHNIGELGIYVRNQILQDGYHIDEFYTGVDFKNLSSEMNTNLAGQAFDWNFEYLYAVRLLPIYESDDLYWSDIGEYPPMMNDTFFT